ncbi:UNVERIFIED_CONTAM: nitrogen regulatory protein P-II family [Acetivibrio alkalicellulosi]
MEETLNRVTIITRREKQEELRQALSELGIKGMTVTRVEGCGVQRVEVRYYRGVKTEVRLLPKVMFEMVVSEIPVESIVKTAREVLYTGEIGDGKIFVEEEQSVFKIRTKEEGKTAL